MIRDLYELVLKAFVRSRSLDERDERRICEELQGLQTPLHFLREHFATNGPLSAAAYEYGDLTADAYLCAYVPGYIAQARSVFRQVINNFEPVLIKDEATLEIGLFCCGPAPEAVAAVDVFQENFGHLKLVLHLFDYRHKEWSPVREALLDVGVRSRWSKVEIHTHDFNIVQPQRMSDHSGVFKRLDMVVIQNVDNEVGEERPAMNETIQLLANDMKSGATLILSDVSSQAVRNHDMLRPDLERLGELITPEQLPMKPDSPDGPIRECLLRSDTPLRTWPRTRIYYHRLMLRRS